MWPTALVLALVLAVPAILALQTVGCDGTRAAVLECATQLFDLDHNGEITPVEAAVALGGETFTEVPAGLTWQFVMLCDVNDDGVITIEDWQQVPPNATCLPTQNCLDIACSVCAANGFVQSKRREPVQQQQPSKQSAPTVEGQLSPDQRRALTSELFKKAFEEQEAVRARIRKARAEAATKKTASTCFFIVFTRL